MQNKGTITGYVVDSVGTPQANVDVITNPGEYTATTDDEGAYTLSDVPTGDYEITAGSGATAGTTTVSVKDSSTSCSPIKVTASDIEIGGSLPPGTYSVTVTVTPTGAGNVALAPTGGTYSSGTVVTLTAQASSGYAFSSWSGGASGTSASTTVTVTANVSVTATFVTAVTYTLTTAVAPSGAGSVGLNPVGGSYGSGTVVTISATANSGYVWSSWSGDASGALTPTTITMNGNKSVTANFGTAVGQLFTDNFESWSGTKGSWDALYNDTVSGNIITPETTYANSPTKSLHVKANATASAPYLETSAFTAGAPRYVRFYFYLPTAYANSPFPLWVYSATNRRLLIMIGSDASLTLQGDGDWTGLYHDVTLTKGAWHRVELMCPVIPSLTAVVRWWADGNECTQMTDDFNNAGTTWNRVVFGMPGTGGAAITEEYFLDDIAISDSSIGP
jgi:hypothetical protein